MSKPHTLSTPVSRMGDTVQMPQLARPDDIFTLTIPDTGVDIIAYGDAVALKITLISGALEIFNGASAEMDAGRPGRTEILPAPGIFHFGLGSVDPYDDEDWMTGETVKKKSIALRGRGGPAEVNLVFYRGTV